MAGREPPFRYWPANVKKRPSQREALSCLYNLCTFFFCAFCAFSRLFLLRSFLCATSGIAGNADIGRNSRKKAQKTQKEKFIVETGAFFAGREPPSTHCPVYVPKSPRHPYRLH